MINGLTLTDSQIIVLLQRSPKNILNLLSIMRMCWQTWWYRNDIGIIGHFRGIHLSQRTNYAGIGGLSDVSQNKSKHFPMILLTIWFSLTHMTWSNVVNLLQKLKPKPMRFWHVGEWYLKLVSIKCRTSVIIYMTINNYQFSFSEFIQNRKMIKWLYMKQPSGILCIFTYGIYIYYFCREEIYEYIPRGTGSNVNKYYGRIASCGAY